MGNRLLPHCHRKAQQRRALCLSQKRTAAHDRRSPRQPPRRAPAMELAANERQRLSHVQAMDAYGIQGQRITSELNQRKYCEACGIPLNAFGNWRAKFKAEPQSPARKVLYRRGSISHALSHGLNHDLRGSGPIVPPARAVVVGGSAKQTNGRYFGGDAAGFALLRGSSAPWDRGTCSAPVEAGDNARGCTFVRRRRDHFRILRSRKVRIR